jgi:hypothetical protein
VVVLLTIYLEYVKDKWRKIGELHANGCDGETLLGQVFDLIKKNSPVDHGTQKRITILGTDRGMLNFQNVDMVLEFSGSKETKKYSGRKHGGGRIFTGISAATRES